MNHNEVCKVCGSPTGSHREDWGNGITEAWGVVTNHHDWIDVCNDCGAAYEPVTFAEYKESQENE